VSNIKEFEIRGVVPFNWLTSQEYGDGKLDESDRAWLAGLLLAPSVGADIEYWNAPGVDLPNGGYLTMYGFRISGREALAWSALRRLVEVVQKAGTVTEAWGQDVEDLPSMPIDLKEAKS
jgi:hypothetical protein